MKHYWHAWLIGDCSKLTPHTNSGQPFRRSYAPEILNSLDINHSFIAIILTKAPKKCKWSSLSSSHGSWIYNYLCNQCLSPLELWESRSWRDVLDTTLCDTDFSDLWQVDGFLRVKYHTPPNVTYSLLQDKGRQLSFPMLTAWILSMSHYNNCIFSLEKQFKNTYQF